MPDNPTTPANPSLDDLAAVSRSRFDLAHHLERGHDWRKDAAWLDARLADPGSVFVPLWKMDNLVAGDPARPVYLQAQDVAPLLPHAQSLILLGVLDNKAYFAVGLPDDIGHTTPETTTPLAERGQWVNMRAVADTLSPDEWAVLAHARAMAHWHSRARFCGDCGSPTESTTAGYVRKCTNPACAKEHFPRMDPAIIVLVFHGERCLLGRQGVWPQGRYSTLAGFMEPGESVEQAVAREVHEEAGVRLREVRYYGSQSFPFPASLMLGFHAEALTTDITLNDGELADARWFTRRELRDALDAGTVGLPPRFAISHQLISAWFNAGDCGTL